MINGKDLRNMQLFWVNTEWSDFIRIYYCHWNFYIIKLSVYTVNEHFLISAVLEITLDFEPNHVIFKTGIREKLFYIDEGG